MSQDTSLKDKAQSLIGSRIKAAASSLESFDIKLDGESSLCVRATGSGATPLVGVSMVATESLSMSDDAVCKVDWSWIVDAAIVGVNLTDRAVSFKLDPAGPLTVSVQVWQDKPFLAFQPFKAPAR